MFLNLFSTLAINTYICSWEAHVGQSTAAMVKFTISITWIIYFLNAVVYLCSVH